MSVLIRGGLSATLLPGTFACEEYISAFGIPVRGRLRHVMWDYRDTFNVLHSGVADTVEQAERAASWFGYRPEGAQTVPGSGSRTPTPPTTVRTVDTLPGPNTGSLGGE